MFVGLYVSLIQGRVGGLLCFGLEDGVDHPELLMTFCLFDGLRNFTNYFLLMGLTRNPAGVGKQ